MSGLQQAESVDPHCFVRSNSAHAKRGAWSYGHQIAQAL